MCGIVGVFGTGMIEGDIGVFRDLLVMDTVRGFDSTGMFRLDASLKKGETPAWVKDTSTGGEFVKDKEFTHLAQIKDLYGLIGHNRAATVGSVSVDAAHPFQEGAITLVHNGTLTRTDTMDKCQDTLSAYNDSHTICHNLALVSPEKALDVVEQLAGAYALVWHDARDQTLNFLRNSQRPLHIGAHPHRKVLYLSSDVRILHAALARGKMSAPDYYELDSGVHVKFKVGRKASMEPTVKSFTPGKGIVYAPTQYSHGSSNRSFGFGGWGKSAETDAARVKEVTVNTPSGKKPVPRGLIGELKEWSLRLTDELPFQPCLYRPGWRDGENNRVTVSGLLDMGGWHVTAEIHGLAEATIERYGERPWTVRPVGMKYSQGKTDHRCPDTVCTNSAAMEFDYTEEVAMPIVICKVVSLHAREYHPATPPKGKDEQSEDNELNEEVKYTRRNGTNIWDTPEARAKAISNGCIQCGGSVDGEDPEHLMWVNGGVDPLCRGCVEETKQSVLNG